jgi:hypothetical protein
MIFKVYEMETAIDVTTERNWYIDKDGDLWFLDRNWSMVPVKGTHYYRIEIEVV